MAASPLVPSFFTAAPVLLVTPVMALVMPAAVVARVISVVDLWTKLVVVISPTSTWAVNVNNVYVKRSETKRGGGIYRSYSVRNCGKIRKEDSGNERQDPVNTLPQLVASLLTASHLPKLEGLQDDRRLLKKKSDFLRGR